MNYVAYKNIDGTITKVTILEIKTDNNNIIVSEFNSSIISK